MLLLLDATHLWLFWAFGPGAKLGNGWVEWSKGATNLVVIHVHSVISN